jgi:hypothetical protein
MWHLNPRPQTIRSFQASQISCKHFEIKRKRKAGRGNNTTVRHTKVVIERLDASGCITSGKSKINIIALVSKTLEI